MGFRYALLASDADPRVVLEAFKLGLIDSVAHAGSEGEVALPDRLQPGKFTLASRPDCVAIAFPFQLLTSANYDLRDIVANLPGYVVAIGQDDTTGETWYSRYNDGSLVASYHCGDGIVVTSEGDHPQVEPSEWTESDVFNLLPESLKLDNQGELRLEGQTFTYGQETTSTNRHRRSPWWKFW